MITSIIVAVLGILATVIPVIVQAIKDSRDENTILMQHSLDESTIGVERVRDEIRTLQP